MNQQPEAGIHKSAGGSPMKHIPSLEDFIGISTVHATQWCWCWCMPLRQSRERPSIKDAETRVWMQPASLIGMTALGGQLRIVSRLKYWTTTMDGCCDMVNSCVLSERMHHTPDECETYWSVLICTCCRRAKFALGAAMRRCVIPAALVIEVNGQAVRKQPGPCVKWSFLQATTNSCSIDQSW